MPDLYEPNDSLGGGATNLGVVSTALSIPNLSIDSYNEDWFKFQTTGNGATTVGINFLHAQGDLDLQVRDFNGNWLGSSTSSSNNETVNLSYLPAGTYYAQIYGWNGASNPNYTLNLSTPSAPLASRSRLPPWHPDPPCPPWHPDPPCPPWHPDPPCPPYNTV
ncbi:Peptidase C11 clostripain [Planktothrix agardhii]|uniref:PPC domain-containing protein n=1 Tax=Planktothrix agardhii TaxID=1160 RepID=UPI0020A6E554|nr:PPC domain-containing protein [Planktothrix agardhii]CAD5972338.1 Peptidase C11 clostripain [Planktothrix agardhii]